MRIDHRTHVTQPPSTLVETRIADTDHPAVLAIAEAHPVVEGERLALRRDVRKLLHYVFSIVGSRASVQPTPMASGSAWPVYSHHRGSRTCTRRPYRSSTGSPGRRRPSSEVLLAARLPCGSDVHLDAREQLACAERLDQVIVGAGVEAGHARLLAGRAREQDHRRRACVRRRAARAAARSRPARHHDVREHQIRRRAG